MLEASISVALSIASMNWRTLQKGVPFIVTNQSPFLMLLRRRRKDQRLVVDFLRREFMYTGHDVEFLQ